MKKILLLLYFTTGLAFGNLYSQSNTTCNTATPICADSSSYPLPVTGMAETGPYYDCLLSQPNPSWYYVKTDTSGIIVMDILTSNSVDVDFICWGPFSSPSAPCTAQLDSGQIADCSYSTGSHEILSIPSAVNGEYYLLLITNYSGQTGTLSISVNASSTGSIDTSFCVLNAAPGATASDRKIIFPNPANNFFTVMFDDVGESGCIRLRILNSSGQLVHSESCKYTSGKFSKNLDLSDYAAGIYFIQLQTDKKILNAKLIKQ